MDTGDATEAEDATLDTSVESVVPLLVPVALAVVTWGVLLLGVGLVARVDPSSPLSLLPLVIVGALAWPLVLVAPWRPGATDRVLGWARGNRTVLGVALGLLVARWVPFVPDFVVGLLDLPFRSAGVLFGAELFYRRHVGLGLGRALRSFGQWYLEAVWLVVLAMLAVGIGRWLVRAGGGR